jgi:hypothetical protein
MAKCKALTKKNIQCKKNSLEDSIYCQTHRNYVATVTPEGATGATEGATGATGKPNKTSVKPNKTSVKPNGTTVKPDAIVNMDTIVAVLEAQFEAKELEHIKKEADKTLHFLKGNEKREQFYQTDQREFQISLRKKINEQWMEEDMNEFRELLKKNKDDYARLKQPVTEPEHANFWTLASNAHVVLLGVQSIKWSEYLETIDEKIKERNSQDKKEQKKRDADVVKYMNSLAAKNGILPGEMEKQTKLCELLEKYKSETAILMKDKSKLNMSSRIHAYEQQNNSATEETAETDDEKTEEEESDDDDSDDNDESDEGNEAEAEKEETSKVEAPKSFLSNMFGRINGLKET